jgi:DNA-binding transcriptional LysR family regulator
LQRDPLLPGDILAYPLITSTTVPPRLRLSGSTQADATTELFSRWSPSSCSDSIATMKQAVRASEAVTLLSLYMARHELERNELKILPVSMSWVTPRFAFMYLSHRTLSPLAEAFIRVTKSIAAEVEACEKALFEKWIVSPGA